MNLSKNSGNLLLGIGVIHNLVGFAMGWPVLVQIVQSGFVNSINSEMDRNAIFWFLFSGFMMMMLGLLMQNYIKATNRNLPSTLGYQLLALAIIGCTMMPASGIWLALPTAIIIIVADKKETSTVKGF